MLVEPIAVHGDLSNIGIVIGKLIATISAIYFTGIVFYQNYFDIIIDSIIWLIELFEGR